LDVDAQLDLAPIWIEDVNAFGQPPLRLVEDRRLRGMEHIPHETERLGWTADLERHGSKVAVACQG